MTIVETADHMLLLLEKNASAEQRPDPIDVVFSGLTPSQRNRIKEAADGDVSRRPDSFKTPKPKPAPKAMPQPTPALANPAKGAISRRPDPLKTPKPVPSSEAGGQFGIAPGFMTEPMKAQGINLRDPAPPTTDYRLLHYLAPLLAAGGLGGIGAMTGGPRGAGIGAMTGLGGVGGAYLGHHLAGAMNVNPLLGAAGGAAIGGLGGYALGDKLLAKKKKKPADEEE